MLDVLERSQRRTGMYKPRFKLEYLWVLLNPMNIHLGNSWTLIHQHFEMVIPVHGVGTEDWI